MMVTSSIDDGGWWIRDNKSGNEMMLAMR